jgi:hypothetical protein
MVKIVVQPGDTLTFEDEDGKEILHSTYDKVLSVLREDHGGETEDDELGELVTYKIPQWLANDKGVQTKVSGTVQKETNKAILLQVGQPPHTDDIWLPKSQITLYVPTKDKK